MAKAKVTRLARKTSVVKPAQAPKPAKAAKPAEKVEVLIGWNSKPPPPALYWILPVQNGFLVGRNFFITADVDARAGHFCRDQKAVMKRIEKLLAG